MNVSDPARIAIREKALHVLNGFMRQDEQLRIMYAAKYANLLNDLAGLYSEIKPFGLARDKYTEVTSKIELFTIASQLNSLVTAYEKEGEKAFQNRLPAVKNSLKDLFPEYSPTVDRELYQELMVFTSDPDKPKAEIVQLAEKLYAWDL